MQYKRGQPRPSYKAKNKTTFRIQYDVIQEETAKAARVTRRQCRSWDITTVPTRLGKVVTSWYLTP